MTAGKASVPRNRPRTPRARPTTAALARDVAALLRLAAEHEAAIEQLRAELATVKGRVSARLSRPPPKA